MHTDAETKKRLVGRENKKSPNMSKQKEKCEQDRLVSFERYLISPNQCKCCNAILSYDKRKQKFCGRSCSASYNNSNRDETIKNKTIATLKNTIATKSQIKNQFGVFNRRTSFTPDGPYTKIYLCICKYSGQKFYSATVKTVHPNLTISKERYNYACKFTFGISNYTEWFSTASELIRKHGWYSTPGSRKGTTNLNGISRDHLYSVHDGWINSVPPHILRHPANCNLVTHKENQSKNRKSKITLYELYERIERFNRIYGER